MNLTDHKVVSDTRADKSPLENQLYIQACTLELPDKMLKLAQKEITSQTD